MGRQSDEKGENERGKRAPFIGKHEEWGMANLWEDQQRISKDPWERSKMERSGRQINAAH